MRRPFTRLSQISRDFISAARRRSSAILRRTFFEDNKRYERLAAYASSRREYRFEYNPWWGPRILSAEVARARARDVYRDQQMLHLLPYHPSTHFTLRPTVRGALNARYHLRRKGVLPRLNRRWR